VNTNIVNLPAIPQQPTAAERSSLQPGARLVPALVGTFARNQVAYIPCPSWCTEDHTAEPSALEDVTHYADTDGVEVPSFTDDTTAAYVLLARLESDPVAGDPRMRGAHVLLWEDAAPTEARLTPEMAEELADDLVGFAAHLRHLARTARLANQAGAEVA
jgi:hypothetical protein